MTDTSGEINLQSKQDIICHVAKMKLATSDYTGVPNGAARQNTRSSGRI